MKDNLFELVIKIRSGTHNLVIYSDEEYEHYIKINKRYNLLFYFCLISVILVLISLILIVFKNMYILIIFSILLFILTEIALLILSKLAWKKNHLIYDLIIKDLCKQNIRILYENKKTGTITYLSNQKRVSISVFKGYNSHWK